MEDKKWFLFTDGLVSGPFTKFDIEVRITSFPQALIWGRGQHEWYLFDRWIKAQSEHLESENKLRQQSERMWRIKMGEQELRPMSQAQMLDFLRDQKDYSSVKIWTEGYTDWKEIYQIHKVMDELGVSRRSHPRVPIMGTITCEAHGDTFTAQMQSISEGGLGMVGNPNIRIGEKFKVIIKSPNLYTPIHSTAEVVFVSNDGHVGMKFVGLHPESKSAIIEFVKKFSENTTIRL